MANKDAENNEEKEEKKIPKTKTIINYTEVEGKISLSIFVVDKKGEPTKINPESDKALAELKKFVKGL